MPVKLCVVLRHMFPSVGAYRVSGFYDIAMTQATAVH
jgi:hypothetical protein